MANKPTQPLFPLGIETAEQSKLKGILNTDIIEHGPDAIMTVPETKAADGLPSAVRYNSETDDFEGFYEHGGWLPLGGGGVRWEVLPHAPTATLESGRGYLINNTSGASTVVLPLPTRIGDSVTVCDMYGKFSVYPLTIDPNGNAMYGNVEAMTISTDSATATFTWTGDARGWIITAGVGLGQGRVYSRTIYTDTLGFPTSEVTLTTQPTIVDVYVDGKRLVESKYSLSGYEVRFSPSLPAGVELQVVQYVPIQLGLGSGGSDSGITPWVYNGGAAVGGETTISVPDLALGVPFITINGYANYPGFAYSYDAGAHVLTFGTPLEAGDMVVLMLSGDVAGNIPVNTSAGFLAIEALRRTYAEAGYNLVDGSFGRGGTVNTATDVLLNEVDGKAYSWPGGFPKTVLAGSTPDSNWSDRSPNSLRKVSFDLFGATDSPYTPSSQELKVVVGGGTTYPGKLFVLSRGGGGNGVLFRLFNGNIATPSLPSGSENGSWALWRVGVVQAIEYAWVYKKPTSFTGTWSEADVVYSAVDIFSDPQLGAYMPLKTQRSSSGGSGSVATVNVVVGHEGKLNIGFMGTSTGPLAQKILVDGVLAATVNLRTPSQTLLSFEIKVTPGARVITFPHEEASTNLNIIGVNFLTLAQLQHWNTDVNSWASYNKSPGYVTNEGASDYAFRAKGGDANWAGSYHGGEYERASPEFSLDHRLFTPSDNFIGIGRRLSILQRTQLRWSSTSESLDIDSLTLFMDAAIFMQCAISNANLRAHTAYLGMNTASPAFDSAIGSKYYDQATTDGENYTFGPCQQVTQIERGTGRLMYTRFSRPPLLDNFFGGPTVSYANGAYAKLYSGFVRNTDRVLPKEFSFGFYKAYL